MAPSPGTDFIGTGHSVQHHEARGASDAKLRGLQIFNNYEFDNVLFPARREFAALSIGYKGSRECPFQEGNVYTILS